MPHGPLTGFTVGVTAHRRAREQIEMLERRGATVVHGPTIETHPLAPEGALAAAIDELIADPPDLTVLSTGIGVRAWFESAASQDKGEELLTALSRSTVLVRGPKAHGAAVTNGLGVDWHAPNGTAAEVVARLRELRAAGRRVAVQLDGAVGAPLAAAIAETGATVIALPVYEWSLPSDTTPAERLVTGTLDGRIDGITFTARPQVENLAVIADGLGLFDDFAAALRSRVTAVCVGPVCASALAAFGAVEPVVPPTARLGAMVLAVADDFAARRSTLVLAGVTTHVQGRAVFLDLDADRDVPVDPILLTDRERDVLRVLAGRPGVVWSKQQLLDRVWSGTESDPHVVEVTVGRLRQRLGEAGAGIETVIRRGYRLTET